MKIFDALHGFIHFNEIEAALIDSEPFQRLRYIHQLGITYLVYPGGTHTRFEHSLGTMHLAGEIFDKIAPDTDRDYWKQIVRLAALCHDLGHLPFSHVGESRLLGKGGHEVWTLKIIESEILRPVWDKVEALFPDQPVIKHIEKVALGEKKFLEIRPEESFTEWESLYAQIVAGDFFGADRIDYLLRDAKSTGLSYGLFDYAQLIEMLVILPDKHGQLSLGVEENGVESCEALLLARHFMLRRVYHYPSAKAYSFHLARFMEWFYRDPSHFSSVDSYLAMNEPELYCSLMGARKDPSHPGHYDANSLLDRGMRFQAIHLSHEIDRQQLEQFQKSGAIPPSQIHWELGKKSSLSPYLSLPILSKNPSLSDKEKFSEIAIPPDKKNWLFLAPEYDFAL
ncbi:MAG: Deoxyguanosinetriphosphate triphosphohydrolase-like protein [Chlamydiae bacterium]|nr:Deoxyguanosinetriphosphate triphosphohydrolase-like protein [Chlamydiota bacterium]